MPKRIKCPGCGEYIDPYRSECGGEGEGICPVTIFAQDIARGIPHRAAVESWREAFDKKGPPSKALQERTLAAHDAVVKRR